MTQALLYLFFAFFVAVLLTPALIHIATRREWFDHPNLRKVHLSPVPRLGGVAVFIGLWLSWFTFTWRNPSAVPWESREAISAIFWASLFIWFLGLYDDLKGANAWKKLTVQIGAAAFVVYHGIQIRLLHNPLGHEFLVSSPLLVWILSVGWIVFVTNSINLIDGLDGLATGVCFITALTIFFIAKELGSPHLPFLAIGIAGSCLGFLLFNFSPARIFLGDSGSLSLGFLLACLSIIGTAKRSTAIVMFGPLLILALPVLDAVLAIGRRFLRNPNKDISRLDPRSVLLRLKEIFQADREHIHHALLSVGLSQRSAVILLYCVTMIMGVTAYRTAVQDHVSMVILVFSGLSLALIYLRRMARKRGM